MYHYEDGTTRWRRFNGRGDIRAYRAPRGWTAFADLIELDHRVSPRLDAVMPARKDRGSGQRDADFACGSCTPIQRMSRRTATIRCESGAPLIDGRAGKCMAALPATVIAR